MSYTVDELEAACKHFEQEFFEGKACESVRNVLVNVIKGGHRIPKRKAQNSLQTKKKPKVEEFVKRNLRKRSFKKIFPELSRQPNTKKPKNDMKGGQDTPQNSTFTPSTKTLKHATTNISNKSIQTTPTITSIPTYMELLEQVNGPQKRLEILLQRIYFQYEFLMPRIFKDGKIRHPLANTLVCLRAWYLVIEDLCESLVAERGVNVLSGGEINTDLQSVIKGIRQISTIIQYYPYLQACSWPMFNALIEKVFMTYLIVVTA